MRDLNRKLNELSQASKELEKDVEQSQKFIMQISAWKIISLFLHAYNCF